MAKKQNNGGAAAAVGIFFLIFMMILSGEPDDIIILNFLKVTGVVLGIIYACYWIINQLSVKKKRR